MILEHRELLRVLDRVVGAVLLLEEVVDLRGGELVRVAAVDSTHDGVARLDVRRSAGSLRRRCRARIFSAIVIGRCGVSGTGSCELAALRRPSRTGRGRLL